MNVARTPVRAAAVAAALTLFGVPLAAAGGPHFDGPTIANPSRPPLFALHDQDGHVVRLADQRGNVVLITFLYTHCPDVCPLTANNLNTALTALGKKRTHVRVFAISVDPRGDTRAAVRRFVHDHRLLAQFRYLTGSPASLKALWAAYNVQSVKQAGSRVDHTLYTLLLDPQLRGRVLYDATAKTTAILHDIRLLLPPTA